MIIKLFDTSLNLVAAIEAVSSAYYAREWHDVGSFAFELNYNIPGAELLAVDMLVMFDDDANKCGFITEIKKTEGPNGKGDQRLTVKGSETKGMLSWRQVLPPAGYSSYTNSDYAEDIIKELITAQMGTGAATARQIASLSITPTRNAGANYELSARYDNMGDVIKKVSTETGVGYWVSFDAGAKLFRVDCGSGVDRRATQSTNGRVIFSSDYDTIENAVMTKSNIKKRNVVYAAGQGVGDERIVAGRYSGTEPEGLARREFFYDIRALDTTAKVNSAGDAKLVELSVDTYVDARALVYSQYQYGVDYNLGDLVTVQAYGESVHPRIVGVKESWSNGKYDIDLTFDRNYPEAVSSIKAAFGDTAAVNALTEGVVIERYTDSGTGTVVIKKSDGTMIQYGSASVGATSIVNQNIGTYGWSYYLKQLTISFVEAFVDMNYTVVASSYLFCGALPADVSSFNVYRVDVAANTRDVDWMAIGRWRA